MQFINAFRNPIVTLIRISIKIMVSHIFVSCIKFITDGVNFSNELALHPVHLTPDKEGNLPPSALVPFCSYQGESNHLGRDIVTETDNMTVCDKFQPTILEGQLCYTLDVAKLGNKC